MRPPDLEASLRSIGGPVCLAAADAVHAATRRGGRLTLTLRGADLGPAEVRAVADGIGALSAAAAPALVSLSLSHSRRMGDAAAADLLDALPGTVDALGLVGCGLGDAAGAALLGWAARCPTLSMLCVEGNPISHAMRRRLAGLAEGRPGLLVVV